MNQLKRSYCAVLGGNFPLPPVSKNAEEAGTNRDMAVSYERLILFFPESEDAIQASANHNIAIALERLIS